MNPGPLIRQHRLTLGVSQATIARLLNCHRSRYNRLEAGKLRWKWEDVNKVCYYLEMDIKEIAVNEWKTFTSYEDWQKNRWHPHTPIHSSLLDKAGGKVIERVGISNRAVYQMPDGSKFEEGLGHDGACYPREEGEKG